MGAEMILERCGVCREMSYERQQDRVERRKFDQEERRDPQGRGAEKLAGQVKEVEHFVVCIEVQELCEIAHYENVRETPEGTPLG